MKPWIRLVLTVSLTFIAVALPAAASQAQPAAPEARWTLFVPLAATTCAGVELLEDRSFETGLPNPAWQTASNVFSDILDDTGIPPARSGAWKAWMGGDNLVQESLWQTFAVPAGVQGLRISYWWRIDTLEPNHPFDSMQVQIRNSAGTPLQDLETLTDGDASAIWRESSFVVSGYGGQTLQLAFVAQTDTSRPTSFFVDDVSVLRTCPAGLAGDVTGDCQVTALDVQDTATHWGETLASACYATPYDQNSDGLIDIIDVQQVAGQWPAVNGR